MIVDLEWRQFVWIAGLMLGWTGFLVGLIRQLVVRHVSEFEDRIGDLMTQTRKLDGELGALRAELPLHYHRREDAIREYTAINAKLDRLYEVLSRRSPPWKESM